MHREISKLDTLQAYQAPPFRSLLLCFSHLRWDFVYQRPQHLMSRAARDHKVIFFEEPIIGEPGSAPGLEMRRKGDRIQVAVPRLPPGLTAQEAASAQRDMIDRLIAAEAVDHLTLWYYTPMAMAFSAHLAGPGGQAGLVIYDCMDELSAFKNPPPDLPANEDRLFEVADLVFTGGRSLYEAKRHRHPEVHAFPSSIDKGHFAEARRRHGPEPRDQAQIPHPRIGFFGVIDERMDLDLVLALALRRPDWHFVMIGPVVKIDPASLPQRPNIHWLGGRSYDSLPQYLAGWDLGFMPFALNDSTRFISPTKTPEFLAAGRRLISSAITDVVQLYGERGLVAIAHEPAGWVAQAEELLLEGATPQWLAAVDLHLAEMSWDRTFDRMQALMAGVTRDTRKLALGGADV